MPPPVSDDEISSTPVEEVDIPIRKTHKKKATREDSESEDISSEGKMVKKRNGVINTEDDEEEEEDDDLGDEEFIVETIKTHLITEEGIIMFQVKWEGYEKRSDLTWEPEENLRGTADEILESYLELVGGREAILNQGEAEVNVKKRGKKRGRASSNNETAEKHNGQKSRKSTHPASSTPPASLTSVVFKPPAGSWEEMVQGIDACEGADGQVMVFLSWPGGQKTQHPLDQVYQRCPQKMLRFYESHLSFTSATHETKRLTDVFHRVFKKGTGTATERESVD